MFFTINWLLPLPFYFYDLCTFNMFIVLMILYGIFKVYVCQKYVNFLIKGSIVSVHSNVSKVAFASKWNIFTGYYNCAYSFGSCFFKIYMIIGNVVLTFRMIGI